ncbi:MAG: PLP-dependent aminotransferase family protein [Methanoregulaceae archaeon]|jgi:2-aminoadipate transaminase|nr:PLP-dependent aminotransferase family protein [Methanoregulaceae archaeon]
MEKTPRSFIREILKVTEDPKIISFAGGLPNPALFPVKKLNEAARAVLTDDGISALQYSTTEGYQPLREFIAQRYLKRSGLAISPENILITNGSQQCLDLIGKLFINRNDPVAIERPGYLGAIQAFSLYEPFFKDVPLLEDGPDTEVLRQVLDTHSPKLFYGVPNFQNPSGLSYSGKKREEVAALLSESGIPFIEDDAYGELRFRGNDLPLVSSYLPDLGIITGSFSKIIAPGMRMGWIAAPPGVFEQVVTAKQASDLHSNYLAQRIISKFLADNDIDSHILHIREVYRYQRDIMVKIIEETFPPEVTFTRPDGGMFLWVTLPPGFSTMDLFNIAIKENVAFVPGDPFYTDGSGSNTMRLNYSNSDEERIVEGITRLSKAIHSILK